MRRWLWVLGAAAFLPACGQTGKEDTSFADLGIETFPDEGHAQVPVGTVVVHKTDPPTSGNQYPDPQPGGFYATPIASGFLVHSLEHGGVVIYYDSAHIAAADLQRLQELAAAHPGTFSQVVAVPRMDATYPVILTAWTHRLRLTLYDPVLIDEFVALFLGNGPEDQRAPMQ